MEAVTAAIATLVAALDDDFAHADVAELLALESALEDLTRRIPAVEHRILATLKTRTSPIELGARTWAEVLTSRMLISSRAAGRRVADAELLGPRRSLTGQPLEPVYLATAAAQARGAITDEHVRIIIKTMGEIPAHIEAAVRAEAEVCLAGIAAEQTPEALRRAAKCLLEVIDPDGPEPNDDDIEDHRQDARDLVLGPQDEDGMSDLHGRITPEFRAYLEPILAKLAAPGMCNPHDEVPCTKGTPAQEAIDADDRTLGQRRHDALMTATRNTLASGELGEHNGLPVTVVIGASAAELDAGTGVGYTAGGSTVPMRNVIRLASHAYLCLTVFDDVTGRVLDFGRTKRCATADQRLVLTYRDRGCTYPGCRVPAYGCQAHHAVRDFADDDETNINDLALACGPHNRLIKEHGWKTVIGADGTVQWIPPPALDTGQLRQNLYHHPKRMVANSRRRGPATPRSPALAPPGPR